MNYISVLNSIPWKEVAISVVQTFLIYWLLIIGLKLAGRRVFGQLGPQDLIILLLISESADLGLTHQQAGFWGAIASVLTVLLTGTIIERIPPLRNLIEDRAAEILKDGKPLEEIIKKNLVQDTDLEKTARQYGYSDISVFQSMVLEGDGSITGVLKPEFQPYKVKFHEANIT